MSFFSQDGEPRKWYEKKRYLFPLAFVTGGLAAFVDSIVRDLIEVLNLMGGNL